MTREDELTFLVRPQLAPNVEDAVFIAGGWALVWDKSDEADGFVAATTRRTR